MPKILDDNPALTDQLGYIHVADAIVAIVDQAPGAGMLPLTIGVLGGWGSGKTSIMTMVRDRLEHKAIKTVWFNAWKYDGKEVVWNALLQAILFEMRTVEERKGTHAREEFLENVRRMARGLARYAAKVGARLVPGGLIKDDDVDAFFDFLSSSAEDPLFEVINQFESLFDALTNQFLDGDPYMVVFVDDLDRCLPENAIQVMEALKLYLADARCVFIIGAEPAVLEEAIRRRYGNNPFLSSTEYLEKIIQVPIMVPRVRTEDLFRMGGALGEELHQDTGIVAMVRIATSRNPRRVKRFLNAYAIATGDQMPASDDERRGAVKILLVRVCFPRLYRTLVVTPDLFEVTNDAGQRWHPALLEHANSDSHLKRFLDETSTILPDRRSVRKWLRI